MRVILALIYAPILAFLLFFNVKLHFHPSFEKGEQGVFNKDLEKRLHHLKREMEGGAAEEMQSWYPEGFVFMNAMYGLAICNYLEQGGGEFQIFQTELNEVYQALKSSLATNIFDEKLPLPNGAFYNGWVAYFEGKRMAVDAIAKSDSIQTNAFKARCEQIASAYIANENPWLESYPLNSWPADNILCMAALRLHDRLFSPKYRGVVEAWLQKIKPLLDPATGLIPHSVNMEGLPLEGARGSSQTLMLTFLPEIDSAFALEQMTLFQRHFLEYPFQLLAVREYPKGKEGDGDIDAGPVIFGWGGAANIVGIAAFQQNNLTCQSRELRNEVEGLTLSMAYGKRKAGFFGEIPMADAFLTWVNSFQQKPDDLGKPCGSWWLFHSCTLAMLLALGFLWRYLTKR